MKKNLFLIFLIIILLPLHLSAVVGDILPGQPVWGVDKRIAETLNVVETKIDIIGDDLSILDSALDSQLEVIESKLDDLFVFGPTYLTQDDIVAGVITISSPGNYVLLNDFTAQITITSGCVSLNLNDRCLTGGVDVFGNYDDIEIFNGTIFCSSSLFYAIYTDSTVDRAKIHDITVKGATETTTNGSDGILLFSSNGQLYNCFIEGGHGGPGYGGGFGLDLEGTNNVVHHCIVSGGNGGDATASLNGGDGRDAIYVEGTNIGMYDCIILTSGSGGDSTELNKNAGSARPGIYCTNSTNIEIANCTILSTGDGGTASNGVANGGDGGDGVLIASNCTDVSVHNCVIRNTGLGGSGVGGGASGTDGKAIDDNVAAGANESKIWANVAYNIANAIKFDLQNSGLEKGFSIPSPPDSVAISIYANTYT